MTKDIENKLKQFLNLYWLRPENGLITTFKSKAFDDIKFESPSLDLSCGDGLFSFIHFGGSFEEDFDYFKSTKAKKFSHNSFIDIYDSFDKNYSVKIKKRPTIKIDYGTDWKQSLLKKASVLNFYNNLILHDNNKIPIPFEKNYFKTIHSNSIYWVNNVSNLLKEIHRILHPDGIAILEVMTPYHLETLKELEQFLSPKAITILDRKRRESMPGLVPFLKWKDLVLKNKFLIEDVRSVYPHKLIIELWNIGLRPISHLLIQMSESLSKEDRLRIKKEWVEIFFQLFKPLLYLKNSYVLEKDPYICFILKKSKKE